MNNQDDNVKKRVEELKKMGQSINWSWILDRAKSIIVNPKQAWAAIKEETDGIKDIYGKYLIVMAAIAPVASFLAGTMNRPKYIFSWLVWGVVTYLIALAMVYLIALVLEFLAPKFGGTTMRVDGFKLAAYSYTPAYVGGILSLIPALVPLQLLFGIYSLYCFWIGLPVFSTVPENKRVIYFIATIISFLVIAALIGFVLLGIGITPVAMQLSR